MEQDFNRSQTSRRRFLQLSTATAIACQILTEPLLARADMSAPIPKDAVVIDQNENPLGPSQGAREALAAVVPESGRYSTWITDDLASYFADEQGLKPEQVAVYPGSSAPLHYGVLAFTSAARSYVSADPGYEAGGFAARVSSARVVNVPLTKAYAHDIKAMLAAAPDAGLFYICTPNNPTGTLTSHSDIEYLVEKKPKGSIVMVDEAYIHFADASSTIDLAKAGKDIIVLRTFSKLYGMAGLRCGFAIARPDLLARISDCSGWTAMPITAVSAALASLKDRSLIPERKKINATIRQSVFDWLDRNGYSYIPSQSNCFLLDTKRDGRSVLEALRQQNVFVGRIWPIYPTHLRITIGTAAEMTQFQTAFHRVMKVTAAAKLRSSTVNTIARQIDGLRVPPHLLDDEKNRG